MTLRPDQSFDAVINIESSIHYPDVSRFFAEVARVLRQGGHFLYADGFYREDIADWEAALAGAPMRMISQRDISAEVVRGMEKNTPRLLDLIGRSRGFIRCAALEGSSVYKRMKTGGFVYRMYCFDKA